MNWLARLYDIDLSATDRVVEWSVVWEGLSSFGGRLLVMAAVMGAVLLPFLFYWREPADMRRPSRAALAGMRIVWLGLLVLVLAGPALYVVKSVVPPGEAALLVDTSRSMAVRDVAGPAGGASELSRLQWIAGRLVEDGPDGRSLLEALSAKREVRVFEFSDAGAAEVLRVVKGGVLRKAPELAELKADGVTTNLGGAVGSLLDALRGSQISAIVMISDGASNSGPDPILSARSAAHQFVTVHTVGVGRPRLADIAVQYVFVDEVVFKDDEVLATVGVRTTALEAGELDLEVAAGEEVLARRTFEAVPGEQAVTVGFRPEEAGEVTLRFSVPPCAGETVTDNNEQLRKIRVIEDKIKVLLVEDEPRWEYRYLKEILGRDRRIDLRVCLSSASRSLAREQEDFLPAFPEEADLFEFDVVVLGEVQPPILGTRGMEGLGRFVGDTAGALIVVAGERHMPWKFTDTVLEEMLPVQITAGPPPGTRSGVPLKITSRGLEEGSYLDLGRGRSGNRHSWGEIPPLHWYAGTVRAKPFAEVLAVAAAGDERREEGPPLIAACTYGRGGKVVFVGTDELWRMRYRPGPSAYERAWLQMVQSSAMAHLLGHDRRALIFTDRREYPAGGVVRISARVMDEDFRPLEEDAVGVKVMRGEKEITQFDLSSVPGNPGSFSGRWRSLEEGEFRIEFVDHPDSAGRDIMVRPPRIELDDPAMRPELLRQAAEAGGGVFLEASEIDKLPEVVEQKLRRVEVEIKRTLWDTPFLALLFAFLFGTELFFRKQAELM